MTTGRRGAVRSEAARTAILEATARLFAARGYDHLTIEGIAAEAGVSKQTIYRWWPNRGALIAECLLEGLLIPGRLLPQDSGDLRADLVQWLRDIFATAGGPDGEGLLRSLIAAAAESADVGRRLHEALGAGSLLADRMDSAVASGQLHTDAPVQEISEAIVGAVLLRALSREPTTDDAAERLVDAVLDSALVRSRQ
ncbi:MAG: TetR/AcrR family transcriptional regulator [Microbacterium sp.]